jgi:hypothetical protein
MRGLKKRRYKFEKGNDRKLKRKTEEEIKWKNEMQKQNEKMERRGEKMECRWKEFGKKMRETIDDERIEKEEINSRKEMTGR